MNADLCFRNGKNNPIYVSSLAVVLSVEIVFQIRENPWQSRFFIPEIPRKDSTTAAGHEYATLSAPFFQQANPGDGHRLIDSFRHVVDRQQGDTHRG